MPYEPQRIEKKWQSTWAASKTFKTGTDKSKPKYYVLDMFPYPSGAGLHVGHPLGYIASDILARYKRHQGFNVLHPMGWDAFGLPAEQYAIQTGQHPALTTEKNIGTYRQQLDRIGLSFDWDREVNTSDPAFYKWTQWAFGKMFTHYYDTGANKALPIDNLVQHFARNGNMNISAAGGEENHFTASEWKSWDDTKKEEILQKYRIAYQADLPVNWCAALGTVLANDEVAGGLSVRGGHPVEQRVMKQWSLRISAYAERLLQGLETLDWSEAVKDMQRNWIGKSVGAEVDFALKGQSNQQLRIFTTRPDTIFGVSFMVLAPESEWVDKLTTAAQKPNVDAYIKYCKGRTERERQSEVDKVTGVDTGAFAIHPFTKKEIPIWIGDYVLGGYGTGAIMAVPAHDERDFEFANQFGLPIREVVREEKQGSTGVPPVKTPPPFFEKLEEIKITERNLPHWTQDAKYYFVTWRLADSLPAELLKSWKLESEVWFASHRYPLSPEGEEEYHRMFSDRIDKALDAGAGSCILKIPAIAGILDSALRHFDGDRYELSAFVIMPNHVHVLFKLHEGQDLAKTLHSWKSFTAHEINKALNQSGPLWQEEYFDRIVRNERHFSKLVEYIVNNPRKAGLCGVTACTGGTPVFPCKAPCFSGDGIAVNSGFLDGMSTAGAKRAMASWLVDRGLGCATINYKLRDWLFSRQRYWGEPFPIVWEDGKHRALGENELPVVQPEMEDFKPTGTPEPPLSKALEWVRYSEKAVRETNTMPQWAGSCWYYLRFCDPKNASRFIGADAEKYWMAGTPGGVDLYVGGTEHAVLHLLYARFWHKVLFDLGELTTPEPFQRLVNQGMILGPDGQKMSKSRGNVITPDSVIEEYGADSLRLYEMFMGPIEQMKPWSMKGVEGVYRFLARVWRLGMEENQEGEWIVSNELADIPLTASQTRVAHATIKKVTSDLGLLAFNTAISQMMVFTNEFVNTKPRPKEALRILLPLLCPFAPHLAEELWSRLGFEGSASTQPWPVHDESLLVESELEIPVQVNGKLRDRIRVPVQAAKEDIEAAARASAKIIEATAGQTVVKVIVVPGKLVNIVAKVAQ